MAERILIFINDQPAEVEANSTVAAALVARGESCRRSVTGQPRGPLCGMGVCYECRVTIDGIDHRLACQTLAMPGMRVKTHA